MRREIEEEYERKQTEMKEKLEAQMQENISAI